MLCAPLPVVEINPPGDPCAVVIWLHGLGASGHDFEPIVPQLQLPEKMPVRFVFPHAPEMAVTAFGGQRARAWFDFGNSIDSAGLKKSVLAVTDLIQNEIDNGVPSHRILLAGFSQGGALAFETALKFPKPLAGLMALSTFMVDAKFLGTETAAVNAKIPILVCHGQSDAVLPVTLGREAHASLQDAGYLVEWREYPMGHEVCMDEIRDISVWLQRVLG